MLTPGPDGGAVGWSTPRGASSLSRARGRKRLRCTPSKINDLHQMRYKQMRAWVLDPGVQQARYRQANHSASFVDVASVIPPAEYEDAVVLDGFEIPQAYKARFRLAESSRAGPVSALAPWARYRRGQAARWTMQPWVCISPVILYSNISFPNLERQHHGAW